MLSINILSAAGFGSSNLPAPVLLISDHSSAFARRVSLFISIFVLSFLAVHVFVVCILCCDVCYSCYL